MSDNAKKSAPQGQVDPVETLRRQTEEARAAAEPDPTVDLFSEGEGRREDGSIGLSKLTMATIRAFPERCKQANGGQGGRLKIATFTGVATRVIEAFSPDTGEKFEGLSGDFAAVRYDNRGEPDGLFKSDVLYFPIGHQRAVDLVAKTGYLSFSLEFWSQPATSPTGYSWSYINLAKLDRNNLSPIDKLISLSVAAGRRISASDAPGLLADLRTPQAAK